MWLTDDEWREIEWRNLLGYPDSPPSSPPIPVIDIPDEPMEPLFGVDLTPAAAADPVTPPPPSVPCPYELDIDPAFDVEVHPRWLVVSSSRIVEAPLLESPVKTRATRARVCRPSLPLSLRFNTEWPAIDIDALAVPDFPSKPYHYQGRASPAMELLMERGFPLVGTGGSTYVFRISNEFVAKVNTLESGPGIVRYHRERVEDLFICNEHPTAFAWTKRCAFRTRELGYEAPFYLQWALDGPFHKHGLPHNFAKPKEKPHKPNYGTHLNRVAILALVRAYPLCKQWAYTGVRTMALPDGTMRTGRWLVCYDYQ